jgi:hypothetical protein
MVLREERSIRKAVAENIFSGRIVEIISKGTTYLLFITGEFNLEIEIPVHAFEQLCLETGKSIKFSLRKSAIHIIR